MGEDRGGGGVRAIVKLALFMIYICVLCYILFFAEMLGRSPTDRTFSYNVVPLHEIKRYISYMNKIGVYYVAVNLLGNVLMFLPFGFLLPSFWPPGEKHHPIAMFLVAFTFSGVVELLQLITQVGSADVDDVILNTAGAMLGYMIYQIRVLIKRRK